MEEKRYAIESSTLRLNTWENLRTQKRKNNTRTKLSGNKEKIMFVFHLTFCCMFDDPKDMMIRGDDSLT